MKLINQKEKIFIAGATGMVGNAIKINNQVINDDKFLIEQSLFLNNYLRLSVGKKKHLKVELN